MRCRVPDSGAGTGRNTLAARALLPGGALVFNTFVARDGAALNEAARQFAEFSYSSFFSRAELAAVVGAPPLSRRPTTVLTSTRGPTFPTVRGRPLTGTRTG